MCLAKLPYGKYFLLFLGLAPLLSSTLTTYPWHCLLPGTIGRSNLILAYALGLLSFRELPVLGEKAGVAMGDGHGLCHLGQSMEWLGLGHSGSIPILSTVNGDAVCGIFWEI